MGTLWRLGHNGSSTGSGSTANGTSLLEPTATLAYSYNDGGTKITVGASYQKTPVTSWSRRPSPMRMVSPSDVLATTGSVISWDGQLGVQTGMDKPVGFLFSASNYRRHYLNNTDPNVYDTRSKYLSSTLQLRPGRLSEFYFTIGYGTDHFDRTFSPDRKQNLFGVGYQRTVSPILAVDSQFNHIRDIVGTRNEVRAGGSLTFPTGKLSADIGASVRPGYGAKLIGQLGYALTGLTDSF